MCTSTGSVSSPLRACRRRRAARSCRTRRASGAGRSAACPRSPARASRRSARRRSMTSGRGVSEVEPEELAGLPQLGDAASSTRSRTCTAGDCARRWTPLGGSPHSGVRPRATREPASPAAAGSRPARLRAGARSARTPTTAPTQRDDGADAQAVVERVDERVLQRAASCGAPVPRRAPAPSASASLRARRVRAASGSSSPSRWLPRRGDQRAHRGDAERAADHAAHRQHAGGDAGLGRVDGVHRGRAHRRHHQAHAEAHQDEGAGEEAVRRVDGRGGPARTASRRPAAGRWSSAAAGRCGRSGARRSARRR